MISVALVSCGLFYSPIKERWNINDPKNELLTFNPIVDGYADSTPPLADGFDKLLAHAGSQSIVLRFKTDDFPDVVAASYLELTIAPNPPGSPAKLSVYRIVIDWETADISYTYVDKPGTFYDDSVLASFTVPDTVSIGEQILIPVTKVFSGDKEKLAYGIMIFSDVSIEFESTETGPDPVLLVEPE
jgi:hypothetical protein